MAAIALIVLLVGGFILYNSSFLAITEVRVEGAQRLTAQRLTELAAVPTGSTLLRIDSDGVAQRLESDPWVASAQIHRVFPATVVLAIEERQIAAVVEVLPNTPTGLGERWLIATDGIWLDSWISADLVGTASGTSNADDGTAASDTAIADTDAVADNLESSGSATDATNIADGATAETQTEKSLLKDVVVYPSELGQLPVIKDAVRTLDPVSGEIVKDEGVANAIAILAGFSPEMRAQVAFISAPDKVKTELTLRNYVHVAFGIAEDVVNKEAAIQALLKEHEGSITYINVRVASRATYRVAE